MWRERSDTPPSGELGGILTCAHPFKTPRLTPEPTSLREGSRWVPLHRLERLNMTPSYPEGLEHGVSFPGISDRNGL